MRVAQSLPDAVVNEAGGLAAAKAIGMLSKAAAPVRGVIFGERSVLMSNLQSEMRAGLRKEFSPASPLEQQVTTPSGFVAKGSSANSQAGVKIHNIVLEQPRVGFGEKGGGSGNKIDQISNRIVLDASGSRIDIGYPLNPNEPYATQEFPGAPRGHGFPDIIDNFAEDAVSFELNNGTKLMQLSGSLNQAPGRFEWIVDPRLGGVSHRMFIVNGSINGIPVKP